MAHWLQRRPSYTDNHILLAIERIGTWIEQGDVVIAVLRTVPSPVDAHVSCLVVAIEHEGMAAAIHGIVVHARVIDWAVVAQFLIEDFHPLSLAVRIAVEHVGIGIAEIVAQGRLCRTRIGSRALGRITHVDSDATMRHQLGHRISLLLGVALAIIDIAHEVVAVISVLKIGQSRHAVIM